MPVDEFGREIPGVASAHAPRPRSASPPPSPRPQRRSYSEDHYRSRSSRRSPSPLSSRSSKKPRQHPSTAYVKELMLCEYVYKSQKRRSAQKDERKDQDPASASEDENREEEEEELSYDDYRRKYCLNYVRAFFNQHIDDSWFRQRYSALEEQRLQRLERSRAAEEASVLRDALLHTTRQFVEQVCLGEGSKVDSRKRRHEDSEDAADQVNAIPTSHVLSSLDRTLGIHEVPPHVTNSQVQKALMELTPSFKMTLFSSTPDPNKTRKALYRSIFVVLASAEQRNELLTQLHDAHEERRRASSSQQPTSSSEGHVPRRKEDMPAELDLQVDCSDPYGRLEVDGDGKGGAPEEGVLPPPLARATVVVSTRPVMRGSTGAVVVLSAAVSSTERIPRDKEAALMLARALDVSRVIPTDCRLDAIMEQVNLETDADCLDVAIAYLRRVHLFSFYNGCTMANHLADVLAGQHATSTIHLRLKNADELLNKEDRGDQDAGPDLLVQRLDDNISKALEDSSQWVSKATFILDETRDAQAEEIEAMENAAKTEWIANHSIVDNDGRARCSFHFCRKLFKDDTFLKKHLLKKHGEFLHAEMAKCHDSFMMKVWDEESHRPVPPVLVDCGTNFGVVPSPVVGSEPMAADPEPDLWQREESRRLAAAEAKEASFHREERSRRSEDAMPPVEKKVKEEPAARGGGGFVDVDDMKDEKVELSFDNVEVVTAPPKKKRKRKKLL